MSDLLKVAVIEGWHPFQVVEFRDLIRSIEGIDPYQQTVENWAVDCSEMRKKYDVLLFYNMNHEFKPECNFCAPAVAKAVEELGEPEGQGIVLLHHAILAYPESTHWSEMVGIENRKFGFHNDQTMKIEVADSSHPIVDGTSNYEMFDETYTMDDAGEGSHILLTTDHEKSMKTIAWTRQYRNARVFCFENGHDSRSWADPNFKRILTRGIHWAAGLL